MKADENYVYYQQQENCSYTSRASKISSNGYTTLFFVVSNLTVPSKKCSLKLDRRQNGSVNWLAENLGGG